MLFFFPLRNESNAKRSCLRADVSYFLRKYIGDVCTQAKNEVTYPFVVWTKAKDIYTFFLMCEFLLGCRILAVIAFNVFIHLKLLDGRKRIEVNWKILQADIQLYTKLTSCLKQLLTLYHRITFCMSQVHFFSLK